MDCEPFSRRCGQDPICLPEQLRRSVLYLIQDAFSRYVYELSVPEIVEAAVASERQEQPLDALFASRYLHDIVVRQEGLSPSSTRDTWLDSYALGCSAAKFLDLVEYMLQDKWRGNRNAVRGLRARFREFGVPHEIRNGRMIPARGMSAGENPAAVLFMPWTPDRNKALFRQTLQSCQGRILWIEKHMPERVLELLHDSCNAPASRVTEVKLLSGPAAINRACKGHFCTFAAQMGTRGIKVEWRILDRETAEQIHDRCIITEGRSYNVPPINSVFGASQMAEITQSSIEPSHFDAFWCRGVDIESWDMRPEKRRTEREVQ